MLLAINLCILNIIKKHKQLIIKGKSTVSNNKITTNANIGFK